jgi:hypothetical protein
MISDDFFGSIVSAQLEAYGVLTICILLEQLYLLLLVVLNILWDFNVLKYLPLAAKIEARLITL